MRQTLSAVLLALAILATGCGTEDAETSTESNANVVDPGSEDSDDNTAASGGIRLVSATDGAAIQDDPPDDLVILDVRTPEEFAEGHLEGAILVDFYDEDFAEQVAGLDSRVPYLVYCRSGNRSGQTTTIMDDLGFVDVADIDGGIISWNDAGLATVTE